LKHPRFSRDLKFKVNDLGGPRCISLHVEDVLKAFKVFKGESGDRNIKL